MFRRVLGLRLRAGVFTGRLDHHPDFRARLGRHVWIALPFKRFVGAAGQLRNVDHRQIKIHYADDVTGYVGGVFAVGHDTRAGENPGKSFRLLLGLHIAHPTKGGGGNNLSVLLILHRNVQWWTVWSDPFL